MLGHQILDFSWGISWEAGSVTDKSREVGRGQVWRPSHAKLRNSTLSFRRWKTIEEYLAEEKCSQIGVLGRTTVAAE